MWDEALDESWMTYQSDDDHRTPLQWSINGMARNLRHVHNDGDSRSTRTRRSSAISTLLLNSRPRLAVRSVTDSEQPVRDENEQFMDGTFFRRVHRSQLALAGIAAGFTVAAIRASGGVRVMLAAIGFSLGAFLAWSGVVTSAASVVRRALRPPPPYQPHPER